jgi:hypothetical protein
MGLNVPEHGVLGFDTNQLACTGQTRFHSTHIALKSFTLVCVGPVMTKSPRASK